MAKRRTPSKSKKPPKAKAAGDAKGRGKAAVQAKDAAPAHLFDDPRNVKRLIYAVYVVCGVIFLLDFVVHRHVDHPWEAFIGFYAVYGFVACVLLVLAAKVMRKLLMRKEEYYDE